MKGQSEYNPPTARQTGFRLLLAASVSLVYVSTMAPGVMTDDSAEFQVLCPLLRPTHPPGYPLLLLIGKAFSQLPFGTGAWRVSLMSAVFGVATVIVLYELLALLLRSQWVAFATALVFALSHTFWMQSVMAEVYTVNAFCHAMLLYLAARYERFGREQAAIVGAMAFLVAFAAGAHTIIVLVLPVYVLWLAWRGSGLRPASRQLLIGLAAFGLGASVYVVLTVRMRSLSASLDLALGGPSRGLLFAFPPAEVLRRFLQSLGYHGYQFPLIAGVVGVGGWLWALRQRPSWWALTTALWLIAVVYALNFDSSDVYVFYIPAYMAVAIWIGFGFDALHRLMGSRPLSSVTLLLLGAIVFPPFVYWRTYTLLEAAGNKTLSRDKGCRYYLFPPKHNADWLGNGVRQLMRTAAWQGALLTDWNYYYTARYFQEIEHLRPDLLIQDVTPQDESDTRPARTLAALAAGGRRHFYFTDEAMAQTSAAGRPCRLHTVGWHVADDMDTLAQQGRRRLQADSSRRVIRVAESDRTAAGKVVFAVESTRLLRGQGVWAAIENVRGLLPDGDRLTSAAVNRAQREEEQVLGILLVFHQRGGTETFYPQRPLHGNAGRFSTSPTLFSITGEDSRGPSSFRLSGQSLFLDNTVYQYIIVPTDIRAGDFEISAKLTLYEEGKSEATTLGQPRRQGNLERIAYLKIE